MTYSHFSPGEIRLSNHNQQEKKWSPNLGEKDIKYNADNILHDNDMRFFFSIRQTRCTQHWSHI